MPAVVFSWQLMARAHWDEGRLIRACAVRPCLRPIQLRAQHGWASVTESVAEPRCKDRRWRQKGHNIMKVFTYKHFEGFDKIMDSLVDCVMEAPMRTWQEKNQETDLTAATNACGMHSCFWYGGGVWILYPPSLWCIIEWELWSMKVLGEGLCCRLEVLYWLNVCVLRQRREGGWGQNRIDAEERSTTAFLLCMRHLHNVRETCTYNCLRSVDSVSTSAAVHSCSLSPQ